MVRLNKALVVAAGVLMSVTGLAHAQLTVSPGNQTGVPGQIAEWTFAIDGASANVVSSFGYGIRYDAAEQAIFTPVPMGTGIACAFEPDLAATGNFQNLSNSQPDRQRVRISAGDFQDPITSFGRGGNIITCQFQIASDAPVGTIPLECIGAASSTDPNLNDIETTCVAGTLEILPAPPTDTPQPTFTSTPPATNTPPVTATGTRTNTPVPPTVTQTRVATATANTVGLDDGCNVGSGSNNSWVMMLLPIAALAVVRRRNR
jgi:hypothetical protein